jgi:hypothetical protein
MNIERALEVPDISIDALVLQVPGLPEYAARGLALEIAHGLAEFDPGVTSRIPDLKVTVSSEALEKNSSLASHVVAEVIREIRRSS